MTELHSENTNTNSNPELNSNNISVVGVGKLGLCLALCLEKSGFNVLGMDIFPDYVEKINNKTLTSYEPQVEEYLQSSKNFKATTNLSKALSFSDFIFIVVDTPNGGGRKFYDHSKLSQVLVNINDQNVKNKNIIICCTVMPNYIDNIGKSLLKDCVNTTLNYNPEFIAQGEIIKGLQNPDIVLVGEQNSNIGTKIVEILSHIYQDSSNPKICRMKPIEAEITKLAINGYITTKISYANMILDVCSMSNASHTTVLEAVGSDSRIGNKYFKGGYSYGGPCFPRDTKALSQYINSMGINSVLIDATHQFNEYHLDLQFNKMMERYPGIQITFKGVTYKNNCKVPIIEESPKLKIAEKMALAGKKVIIKDELSIIQKVKMEYGNLFEYQILDNSTKIHTI